LLIENMGIEMNSTKYSRQGLEFFNLPSQSMNFGAGGGMGGLLKQIWGEF
jgi:hypothetical protein